MDRRNRQRGMRMGPLQFLQSLSNFPLTRKVYSKFSAKLSIEWFLCDSIWPFSWFCSWGMQLQRTCRLDPGWLSIYPAPRVPCKCIESLPIAHCAVPPSSPMPATARVASLSGKRTALCRSYIPMETASPMPISSWRLPIGSMPMFWKRVSCLWLSIRTLLTTVASSSTIRRPDRSRASPNFAFQTIPIGQIPVVNASY